jgi:AcrR family transcriptional regulator
VLEAAAALVDEAGADGLGLRELGRRLGVSHAAIHHHFPSVAELAAALSASWFGDLDRAMATTVEGIPPARALDRFRALGVGYVRYAIAHPHRFRLQFRPASTLPPEADASFLRVLEAVVACAPRAARPVDPQLTTLLAWSSMHGLAMLWLDGAFRDRAPRDGAADLAAEIAALISQLLAPAGAR